MTYYYYDKTRCGTEHCYEVEDIQKDSCERLENMSDTASRCVTIINADNIFGYSSIGEYYQNEMSVEPVDESAAKIYESIVNCREQYPLAVVRHSDGEYECLPVDKVDYFGLMKEYEDFGAYSIPPDYYCDNSMTSAEAESRGMYELAEMYRRHGGLTVDTINPFAYCVHAIENGKEIRSRIIELEEPSKEQCESKNYDAEDAGFEAESEFELYVKELFPDYPNSEEVSKIVRDCVTEYMLIKLENEKQSAENR